MSENALRAEIARLAPSLRARLDAAGFDAERLITLAKPLQARASGEEERAAADRDARNRVRGLVEPPRPGDIADAPAPEMPGYDRLAASGLAAIRAGELALCVMAGGMATRMGGVVKALVEAFDGHTFLELRLNEDATWSRRAGLPIPLWLMTSEATEGPIKDELQRLRVGPNVATFTQDVGLRLTPYGRLLRGEDGNPSTYATGHGDLPDALRRSQLLSGFLARGGKYVLIANLDNLGATIDAAMLGWFIEQAADLMVEVTAKAPGDRGGIPVWADAGDPQGRVVRRLQVLEEFRLPKGFDATTVRVFNTNTFLLRADVLLEAKVHWSWCEVEKKVGDVVAVQFERLLQELTTAIPAAYVRVPREGTASRFLPVKDPSDLVARREDIRAVARARGMT
jgi:UTP--glucose-1-phosphate uridylyltransferase